MGGGGSGELSWAGGVTVLEERQPTTLGKTAHDWRKDKVIKEVILVD
jgi:hypothetical protein